jgi:hypothetical protein
MIIIIISERESIKHGLRIGPRCSEEWGVRMQTYVAETT